MMRTFNVTGFGAWSSEPRERCFIPKCTNSRASYVRLESILINEDPILEPLCAIHSSMMRKKFKEQGAYLIDV